MEKEGSGITKEIEKIILQKLESFNHGRSSEKGRYYILLPNEKTLYYTLWFYSPVSVYHSFIYLSTLELNAIGSVNKALKMVSNSFLSLSIIREIDSSLDNGDDLITFGKYKGHHLQDIYTIDPKYVLWIADKYQPHVKSEYRFKELATTYSQVYLDLQTRRRYKIPNSHFVGTPGEKLSDLHLTITRVMLEDDFYKTKVTNGIPYFYVDQLITAVDTAGNLFLFAFKATDRSLASRTLPAGSHAYQPGEKVKISSAKILKHVELRNIKYTKLGYLKEVN